MPAPALHGAARGPGMTGVPPPSAPSLRGLWRWPGPFAQAQIIGWSLFALVDMVNRQLAYQDIAAALTLTAIVCPVLFTLSAGLRRVYDRFLPGGGLHWPMFLGIVLLSCAGAGLVVAVIAAARQTFGWSIPHWRPVEEIALPFVYYTAILLGWSLLLFWVRADRLRLIEHEAASIAQADALRAEIQQLRLQINPHFLFNALNGIAEEVPEHPAAAVAMLRDLTDYLRHILAGIRTPVVPVEAEIAALAAYLRIQQARFGPRLRTQVAMDPAVAGRAIANGLLQPLAENAMEHGDRSDLLELMLRVGTEGAALRIDIENTGRLAPTPRKRLSHGLGLANLRRRLDVHYPGRHSFSLAEATGEHGAGQGAATQGEATRVIATLVLEGDPCSAS
ncbi:sensor histidine kinase [Ancylobacter dichloromethanicus]|uniref:Sensor histidine kinase n=2 Tax=Ancylobacter dichloromethanicus TaxID=518825 RepID=A0A9W6J7U9_9HYPH|nr:sensor histidine kinase [Ancylobacter dichloromethanicus]